MKDLLENHPLILMEAAIVERLRREAEVPLHETLLNAPLVYDGAGRDLMAALYQGYMDIAREAGLPFVMCTPTWRANRARVAAAEVSGAVNEDAARFMGDLRARPRNRGLEVRVGGLMGCCNDAYRPAEGLDAAAAEHFHAWQAERLAAGGVDFLIAVTLPAVEEAVGLARAMEATGLPYLVSFVIGRDGLVLDGSPLEVAVDRVDAATGTRPEGYMVNCAYPGFLDAARQPAELFARLVGCQANASSLDHCDLDGAKALQADDVAAWGEAMVALNRDHGVRILGGCCGTGATHLRYLAGRAQALQR